MVRKWRRIEVGNSVAGVVVSVVAVLLLPAAAAAVVVAVMAVCVADTWYLGRRLRRTGRLFRTRQRR
jgi:O-antigen/teichoic acid export membrane protein